MELELETERARNGSQQHRLRAANSPQVKNLKQNFAETVLCSTEKQLLQYHRQSGLGGRTVRKYGHRAAKKAQKKNLNSRTVRYTTADCPRIAKQQEQRAPKIASSL
jgi:hypothetical protein